jgi:hypothetical protein
MGVLRWCAFNGLRGSADGFCLESLTKIVVKGFVQAVSRGLALLGDTNLQLNIIE